MASVSTPQGSVRHRNVPGSKKKDTVAATTTDAEFDNALKPLTKANVAGSDRDYKVTFIFVTALAFLTRFWGISHPNEVVFDEVHFGKVSWSFANPFDCLLSSVAAQ